MKKAFEELKEVDPDKELADGTAETAEDLVSAKVMNHPVSVIYSWCPGERSKDRGVGGLSAAGQPQ